MKAMPPKSSQLQIRVTVAQKTLLKQRAAAAGLDVSSYVLRRALPPTETRWEDLLAALGSEAETASALAGLNAFLGSLDSPTFQEVVAHADIRRLSPFHQNYVAAMIEEVARRHGLPAPDWTAGIRPMDAPYFAGALPGLRPYLLREAPVAFKRRNLFVDVVAGDHL